jgi:hypothetical protein
MDKKDIAYIVIALGFLVIVAVVVKPAITGQPANMGTPVSSPSQVQVTTPAVITPITFIPTVKPTPSQSYKTADLVMALNANPQYGFEMDYPSEWSYTKEKSNPPYGIKTQSPSDWSSAEKDINWKTGYRFSSPDGKSYVYVLIDSLEGSALYLYPLDTWTNNTIAYMTESYCHDKDKNPTSECSEAKGSDILHRVLISNDPVTISGNVSARKLVFTSFEDVDAGWNTIYLMQVGPIQGYNFTVPDHYEVGKMVDGPVWDYGMGGSCYLIDFYTPTNQVNTTTDIFNHMIDSFQITS